MATITQETVTRTSRGLTISGTRITLYDVMDYLAEDWPPKLIRDHLNLTDKQIGGALAYIAAHRAEVEAEYQQVLAAAEANRKYWEERNRELIERLAARTPPTEFAELRAQVRANKLKKLGLL